MKLTTISNVAIRGITAAVPKQVRHNADIGGADERAYVAHVAAQVGVDERRVVTETQLGSHLAAPAVESLMQALDWSPDSIDLLVVATQTPDRLFPGIAFDLHRRIGLPIRTVVFDINLGCSAFTHGLFIASSLLPGIGSRAVLVNVDTMSRTLGADDWGNQVLFGDAGAATAIEIDPTAAPIQIALQSDGRGNESVCFPSSAMSFRPDITPRFVLNGPAVLAMALRSVPPMIKGLCHFAGVTPEQCGTFVPHQANHFILEKLIARTFKRAPRIIDTMRRYGNTSSASIPLALVANESPVPPAELRYVLMAGFGTGFSLSAVIADLQSTYLGNVLEVD